MVWLFSSVIALMAMASLEDAKITARYGRRYRKSIAARAISDRGCRRKRFCRQSLDEAFTVAVRETYFHDILTWTPIPVDDKILQPKRWA